MFKNKTDSAIFELVVEMGKDNENISNVVEQNVRRIDQEIANAEPKAPESYTLRPPAQIEKPMPSNILSTFEKLYCSPKQ
jgi:hypothetical protein